MKYIKFGGFAKLFFSSFVFSLELKSFSWSRGELYFFSGLSVLSISSTIRLSIRINIVRYIIHCFVDCQDTRKLNYIWSTKPFLYYDLPLTSLSLALTNYLTHIHKHTFTKYTLSYRKHVMCHIPSYFVEWISSHMM